MRPCRKTPPQKLARRPDEWSLSELVTHLDMPSVTLHHWIRRGVVQARQPEGAQGRWLIWADAAEVNRLRQRCRQHRTFLHPHQATVQETQAFADAPHPQERVVSLT